MKFEGGPNLIVKIGDEKKLSTLSLESSTILFYKDRYIYHLLTDSNLVKISNTTFYDYNSCIDFFIEKRI